MLAITLLIAGADALAAQAVLDEEGSNGDIVPTLRLKTPDEFRDDQTTYDHQDLMCEGLGYCPPPAPKGTVQAPRETGIDKGITFRLSRPTPPTPLPTISAIELPRLADSVSNLDPVIVYGRPVSPWSGDLSLSRIEKLLPCLGCDGSSREPSIALQYGVDTLFTLMRAFFQQPRVRGEPNDEALHMADDGCANDNVVRCQTMPQLP